MSAHVANANFATPETCFFVSAGHFAKPADHGNRTTPASQASGPRQSGRTSPGGIRPGKRTTPASGHGKPRNRAMSDASTARPRTWSQWCGAIGYGVLKLTANRRKASQRMRDMWNIVANRPVFRLRGCCAVPRYGEKRCIISELTNHLTSGPVIGYHCVHRTTQVERRKPKGIRFLTV